MNSLSVQLLGVNRAILLLLCLCALFPIGVTQSSAQSARDDRIDSVTSAAIEFSRLRENRDLFDLYDRMHPDARNVLPRQAFFTWAEGGGFQVPADDPTILHISFGEWTWDGNGQSWDDVAIVSYTQAMDGDGTGATVTGEWIFVHDGQRWRWFPHLSEGQIDVLVAEVKGEPETYKPTFRRASYASVDRFWEAVYEDSGLAYEPLADIVAVTYQPFETGCGLEEEIAAYAIYYCIIDSTVYYDPNFRDQMVVEAGPYGWTMIISHEWGHHIQNELGIDMAIDPELDDGLFPIEFELQADCLAGVYAQDALAMGLIGQDEIDAAEGLVSLAGDTPDTEWDDLNAHGSADQRVQSFFSGFEDGFYGCNLDLAAYAD